MPNFRNSDSYQAIYQAAALIAAANPTFTARDIMELLGVAIESPASDLMKGVNRGYWKLHPQDGEYALQSLA